MPPDSAYVRSMDPDSIWTLEAHLTATLIELTHSVYRAEDAEPLEIPRPGRRAAPPELESGDTQAIVEHASVVIAQAAALIQGGG